MRVALIADIHANQPALEAVLCDMWGRVFDEREDLLQQDDGKPAASD